MKEDDPLFKFGPRKKAKDAAADSAADEPDKAKPEREPLFKFGPRKKSTDEEPAADEADSPKSAREPLSADSDDQRAASKKEPLFKFGPRKKSDADAGDTSPEKAEKETPAKEPGKLFKPVGSKDSFLSKFTPKDKEEIGKKPAAKPRKEGRARGRGSSFTGLILIAGLVATVVGGTVAGLLFYLSQQVPGYRNPVMVTAPTRLDWTFVESKQSLLKPVWAAPYESANLSLQQRYELYVPPDYDLAKRYPLVVFIASDRLPPGWPMWQKLCQAQGVIFAGIHNCGDERQGWERARITLDVLDDVRRNYRTDPDRTYLVGRGTGARLACRIVFALPELFGGVIASDGGDLLRDEIWLRQRVIARLSVAFVVTENDPAQVEIDRLYVRYLKDLDVRTQSWVESASGPETIAAVYPWLEEGVAKRQELAQAWPSSRIDGDKAPTREEWAKALLDEAKLRLNKATVVAEGKFAIKDSELLVAALSLFQGCEARWPDLKQAGEARTELRTLYDDPVDKKSQRILLEEAKVRRVQDLALARAFTAYLTSEVDPAYVARKSETLEQWLSKAIGLWRKIESEGSDDPKVIEEAKKSRAKLEEREKSGFSIKTKSSS